MNRLSAPLLLALAFPVAIHAAAPLPYGGLTTDYRYVELVDMTLASRIVLTAEIQRATRLKGEDAAGVAPDRIRYLIDAQVTGLVSGADTAPGAVQYLVDLPAELRKPKLKGVAVILLARPSSRPGMLVLVGPRAQVPRTPENEARIRATLTASVASDAPPAITGIGHAFHVAGTLPGEGETQIFLHTADNRPISLSIIRRPGEDPRWGVALSELVDASAKPPVKDSFLWYRLACGLPRQLSPEALDGLEGADADQAKTDYQLVLDSLGVCRR